MSSESYKSVSLICLWLAFTLTHLISGANRHFVLSFPASAVASCELGSRFISLSLWDILRMANMPFIDQSSWRSATGLVVAPPPTPAHCLIGTRAPGSPVSSDPDCGLVACLISFISVCLYLNVWIPHKLSCYCSALYILYTIVHCCKSMISTITQQDHTFSCMFMSVWLICKLHKICF